MPDAAGTLRLETSANGANSGSIISKAGTMVTGKWQFIAVSVTRGKSSFLYRDGEEVATATVEPNDLSQPYSLYIGAITGCANEAGYHLNSIITEVAFFNGLALTKDDIDKIMKEGLRNVLAVSSGGKLTTTWATIKTQD